MRRTDDEREYMDILLLDQPVRHYRSRSYRVATETLLDRMDTLYLVRLWYLNFCVDRDPYATMWYHRHAFVYRHHATRAREAFAMRYRTLKARIAALKDTDPVAFKDCIHNIKAAVDEQSAAYRASLVPT